MLILQISHAMILRYIIKHKFKIIFKVKNKKPSHELLIAATDELDRFSVSKC